MNILARFYCFHLLFKFLNPIQLDLPLSSNNI